MKRKNIMATTIALRARKRGPIDKSLLQPLPAELEEITFDLDLLLKATGISGALSDRHRRHLKRLAPSLVTIVDGKPRRIRGRAQ
jgi:hypothetical protein